MAQDFWKAIFALASEVLELTLPPDPTHVLLNLRPESLTRKQFKLLTRLLTAAKQTMAKAWKALTLTVAETKHRLNHTLLCAKV